MDNSGSSLVLVVVALAFVGILVGALLSAVGYVYRLKLYDYNARDNFYYVEQAMDEIYAGVGNQTVEYMKEAYSYTVENMVRYDLAEGAYVNIGDDAANNLFKDKFMEEMATSTYFNAEIANELEKYISNDTVKLDKSAIRVEKLNANGEAWTSGEALDRIVIRNVKLTRTVEYSRSTADDTYTQTITTDIVIGRPDFTVNFNSVNVDYANVFDFAMIADSGVEVNQEPSVPLTINGNIYAAADYYNKDYNQNMYSDISDDDYAEYAEYSQTINGEDFDYYLGSVTFNQYEDGASGVNTYYNKNYAANNEGAPLQYYDGVNELSKYSGFYVNGSDVSVMAETIIVPGTISVFNTGSLSVYGSNGNTVSTAEIWADNVVLGGYTRANTTATTTANSSVNSATAVLRANMYVRDDLEVNADSASFSLYGSYYGYGDSTSKDDRTFIPTVDTADFQYTDSDGTTANRGHYNSSAIIVNGEDATLDLSRTEVIFLAGRSYIELSKTISEYDDNIGTVDEPENVKRETYTYNSASQDYKTGESISTKVSQVAYIPITYMGVPTAVEGEDYYLATLHPALTGSTLFTKYFGDTQSIPCIGVSVSGKMYYYIDFETAYEMYESGQISPTETFNSAEDMAEGFIIDYVAELNNPLSSISDYLTDITNYEDFESGNIILPDTTSEVGAATIYSSGAITSKSGTSFNIISQKDINIPTSLLGETSVSVTPTDLINASDTYESHYNYVKWVLMDLSAADSEAIYVENLVNDRGEASITPINRYFNFNKITATTSIRPKMFDTDNGSDVLNLNSGYSVWVGGDLAINDYDGDGIVRGIILSKGDVTFDSSVVKFEGLIVSGGKIYINNQLTTMSANAEVCKAILRECQLDGSDNAKFVLSLFKGYEDSENENTEVSTDTKTIDAIDYSDVVRYDNWMKNVE